MLSQQPNSPRRVAGEEGAAEEGEEQQEQQEEPAPAKQEQQVRCACACCCGGALQCLSADSSTTVHLPSCLQPAFLAFCCSDPLPGVLLLQDAAGPSKAAAKPQADSHTTTATDASGGSGAKEAALADHQVRDIAGGSTSREHFQLGAPMQVVCGSRHVAHCAPNVPRLMCRLPRRCPAATSRRRRWLRRPPSMPRQPSAVSLVHGSSRLV